MSPDSVIWRKAFKVEAKCTRVSPHFIYKRLDREEGTIPRQCWPRSNNSGNVMSKECSACMPFDTQSGARAAGSFYDEKRISYAWIYASESNACIQRQYATARGKISFLFFSLTSDSMKPARLETCHGRGQLFVS